jgi:hypothetical protein
MSDPFSTDTPDAASIRSDGQASFNRARRDPRHPAAYPHQRTTIVTHVGPKVGRQPQSSGAPRPALRYRVTNKPKAARNRGKNG